MKESIVQLDFIKLTVDNLMFIIQITVFASLFLVVENIRPIHKSLVFSKEKKAELFLTLLNCIAIAPFFYLFLLNFFTVTIQQLVPYQIFNYQIQFLPFIFQVFLGLLLLDTKLYIRHRFTHKFMWRTHSVHHTAEEINWLTGYRLHPFEIIVDIAFSIPFMHILGFDGNGIAVASSIMLVFNLFTHANLNLEYPGFMRYCLSSPNFHRWHHAKFEKEAFNKNFSVIFPFIDLVFGTFYHPAGKLPSAFGILQKPTAAKIKQNLLGYLIYPLNISTIPNSGK